MSTSIDNPTLYAAPSSQRSRTLSEGILAGLVALLDAILILVSGLLVYFTYVDVRETDVLPAYIVALAMFTYLVTQAFYVAGLYNFSAIRSPARQLGKIIAIFCVVILVLVTVAFFLKISEDFSRVWLLATSVSAIVMVLIGRGATVRVLRMLAKRGHLTRNILIYGAKTEIERVLDYFRRGNEPWNVVAGIFDDRRSEAITELDGVAVRGDLQDLIKHARIERAEEIIVALPWESLHGRIQEIFQQLSVLPANVRLCPDHTVMGILSRSIDYRYGLPLIGILDKPMSGWHAVAKRAFDFCVSGVMLLLLSPLMAAIMIGIKLDSQGPVFFRQRRYGFNNELIEVWKYRTMKVDQQDADAERLATPDDPRVTRFGRLLRKTSLDELPQLYNVIAGSMSLVGPRPHALKAKAGGELYEHVVGEYAKRHRVKPGITGWAQVNGWRGETDTEEKIIKRVEHDLYYIDNWSIWLDITILLRTLGVFYSQENAY